MKGNKENFFSVLDIGPVSPHNSILIPYLVTGLESQVTTPLSSLLTSVSPLSSGVAHAAAFEPLENRWEIVSSWEVVSKYPLKLELFWM